jgi:4-hydroxy-2-oxoheptanedioate aldolase
MNAATMVIVQLESAAGLAAIEDIVAVEGVDMVLIGTNDFLADLGRPGEYDHPKVREAYERTIAACHQHGKHAGVGGLSSRPDLVQQFVSLGARFVSTGTDLGFLLSACMEKARQVRSLKL